VAFKPVALTGRMPPIVRSSRGPGIAVHCPPSENNNPTRHFPIGIVLSGSEKVVHFREIFFSIFGGIRTLF
jgi:hypothetical protein